MYSVTTDKLVEILRNDESLTVQKIKIRPMSAQENYVVSVLPTGGSTGINEPFAVIPSVLDIDYAIELLVRAKFSEDIEKLTQDGLYRIIKLLNTHAKDQFDYITFHGFNYTFEESEHRLGRVSINLTIKTNRDKGQK